MTWVIAAALFASAFAVRAWINRGAATATPDEKVYAIYAATWRPGKAYREAIEAFLTKAELEVPPTRFLFFALGALATWRKKVWAQCFDPLTWVSSVSGALAAPLAFAVTSDWKTALLVASSPLSLMLSRRALQDAFATLPVLLGVWAVPLGSPALLAGAVMLTLTTREALLLYLPALAAAWVAGGHAWDQGVLAIGAGSTGAVLAFYAVGGRRLIDIFRKLGQPTDYVRRFQSGMPHRPLVDLVLVSPVTTIGGAVACVWAPLWLVTFVGVALLTHAFITPKNIRFLLPIEIAVRMLCAWLPAPWNWVTLGVGLVVDLRLYFAIGGCKDPVTYNLVVRTTMYTEKT